MCDAPGFYLTSLALVTESAESNPLTRVKPRSTWVITPNQPVVKGTVKPRLTVDVSECRPELLPRSPKFT
jgi:hypothetical protein